MDVKVMAFEISLGRGISMAALYDYIVATSGIAIDKRFIYLDQERGWWRGLVLTSKDIKAFSRLVKERGIVKLSPEAIHNGELAHFNFFLFNPESGKGYFQYYFGSSSINSFFFALKRKYKILRETLLNEACRVADADINNIPGPIKRKFSGRMKCSIVLRQKTFAELMDELSYLKNITFQFNEYVPNQPLFRSLARNAKTIKHSLTFASHGDVSIVRDLVAMVQGNMLKDLRGTGVADDFTERPFRLLDEPETLDRFDFNDIVLETEFDSDHVHQSMTNAPVITRLYEIARRDNWISG